MSIRLEHFLTEDDFDDATAARLIAMLDICKEPPMNCLIRAVNEIRNHIHRRYDCDAIFAARYIVIRQSFANWKSITAKQVTYLVGKPIVNGDQITVTKILSDTELEDGRHAVKTSDTTFTDSRNAYVVLLAVNIATYYAWTTIHPKVSAISTDKLATYRARYMSAVEALKRIADGVLDIEGLEPIANADAGEQRAGGFCNFINPEDYDASIHAEILDSLIRANAATLETCEDRAVSEMRSYMRLRYDCDAIFEARGLGRHPLVLMRAIDIAIYHAFCIHNPQKMSTLRLKRYDDAIAWLKEVQTGAAVIDGAPTLDATIVAANGYYHMQSNAKRSNRV